MSIRRRVVVTAAAVATIASWGRAGRAGGAAPAPAPAAAPVAAPAPTPGAARAVTLDAALAAVPAAPQHQVAAAERRAAEVDVTAAGAWPATTVAVSTSMKTAHLGVVASVPLPVFGTLGANRAVAEADLRVAHAELGAVDLGLRRDVAHAWLELARVEARAALSDAAAAREEELASIVQRRLDAGDAAHAELVQATAVARRARAQARMDRTAIAAASAELARLLGWDPDLPLSAAGGFPALDDVPGGDAIADRRGHHPDAQVAAARTGAEAAREALARRARWPHLSLDLESAIDDPTLPGSDLRVGLAVELPLGGKTAEAIDAAAAHRAAAATAEQATLVALDGQIVTAHTRYQAARARVRSLEDDVLPAEREAATLARASYSEGQGGLVLVLEADRALAEVEADAVDAHAEAADARVDLEWAAGGPL